MPEFTDAARTLRFDIAARAVDMHAE